MFRLRDFEIIAKFCETGQTSSIIFKSIWKHTACHNKAPADDDFRREMSEPHVHMCNAIWGEPGSKMISCWDKLVE